MNPTNGASFGRDTGHESDQTWNSHGKRIFNMAMQASGMTFENLGWLDVEADNSSIIMSTFVRSCKWRNGVPGNWFLRRILMQQINTYEPTSTFPTDRNQEAPTRPSRAMLNWLTSAHTVEN